MTLKYNGAGYAGWQAQSGERTVQETVEKALCEIFGETFRVSASGRTDAGVHALGQVISFFAGKEIAAGELLERANSLLPEDIRVLEAEEVPLDFHARYSALSKTYRYTILRQKRPLHGVRNDVFYWGGPLDPENMRLAAAKLIGTHDFSSFTVNPAYPVLNKVKTISKLDIEDGGGYIYITISGSGFLYKMVRSIVGTLIWAGTGKISVDKVDEILRARDRAKAGPVAKASGLCLVEVSYS